MWIYALSHWRGEQSVMQSCLLNGVAFGALLYFVAADLEAAIPARLDLIVHTILVLGFYAFFIAWTVWFTVGAWRSAASGSNTDQGVTWAHGASFLVALNFFLAAPTTYWGLTEVVDLGRMVLGLDGMSPASFSVDERGYLLLAGDITYDSPDAFEQLLEQHPNITIVQLESDGGYVEPAVILAEMILERGLETYTSINCASACLYPFIAGEIRILDFDAVLGFHETSIDSLWESKRLGADSTDEDGIFVDQGVPRSFLDKANSVPPEDIWEPTLLELVEANIATHIFNYEEEILFLASDYCAANDCAKLPPDELITEGALREPPD